MTGERLHASCVAIGGKGVLLRGRSGSGKSDLALRLIDRGALLVADDQVETENVGGRLFARPPETLAGKTEVRAVGIVEDLPWHDAPVVLVVDLVPSDSIDRLPEPDWCTIAGVSLRCIALAPFEASTPAKIRLLLSRLEAPSSSRNSTDQP